MLVNFWLAHRLSFSSYSCISSTTARLFYHSFQLLFSNGKSMLGFSYQVQTPPCQPLMIEFVKASLGSKLVLNSVSFFMVSSLALLVSGFFIAFLASMKSLNNSSSMCQGSNAFLRFFAFLTWGLGVINLII